MRFEDQTVVVTGAAGALGRVQSRQFAQEGASVLMVDRPETEGSEIAAQINEEIGAEKLHFLGADLGDLPNSVALIHERANALGDVEVLVNNAAGVINKPMTEVGLEEFETLQRVNSHSAYFLTQAFVKDMIPRGSGKIVNIVSITLNGEWEEFSPYVVSKGNLIAQTRVLARELGKYNINVNAVSPGAIPTPGEKVIFADKWQAYNDYTIERQSLKHRGEAADVANTVRFLASTDAKFITGQVIGVDGGWWMS